MSDIDRRTFVRNSLTTSAIISVTGCSPSGEQAAESNHPSRKSVSVPSFSLDEITIDQIHEGMRSGDYTCRSITKMYLERIEALNTTGPNLYAVLEVNPDALTIADELDREFQASGPRGPLHGIPLLLKDNIDTKDGMTTTAGSTALEGSKPLQDSFVAAREEHFIKKIGYDIRKRLEQYI